MSLQVELVDVSLRVGDGVIAHIAAAGDVLEVPLRQVGLVELHEKLHELVVASPVAAAQRALELGHHVGRRRKTPVLGRGLGCHVSLVGHGSSSMWRKMDLAARDPWPNAVATRQYAPATTSPAAKTPGREVRSCSSTTTAPFRSSSS